MDNLYTLAILQESYNKLPSWIKTTLDIQEGEIEVSGWKQFKSRYYSRRLAFEANAEGAEAARSRFIELFFDNQLLLAQIRDYKQLVAKLVDFGSWKTVTTTVGAGSTKSTADGATLSGSKDMGGESVDTLSKNTISDSNSYGEAVEGLPALTTDLDIYKGQEGALLKSALLHYPINSLNQSGTSSKSTRQTESNSVSSNLSNQASSYDNVSRVETSNASDDYIRLLQLELPLLRNRFWDKFSVMFQYG